MAPQTKTTLTYGFVLDPHKGAAFDQHIGPYELRFGSPSRNDSRIGQIDPGMKSTLLSKRPFFQIDPSVKSTLTMCQIDPSVKSTLNCVKSTLLSNRLLNVSNQPFCQIDS